MTITKLKIIPLIVFFIIAWRLYLILGWKIGTWIIPTFDPSFPYAQEQLISSAPDWLWPWANFDGVYYSKIAQSGYTDQYTQALFPLFPLLTGFLSKILSSKFIVSGLIVSHVCLFLSLLLLSKLSRVLKISDKNVRYLFLYLLVFPTSFYLGSLYPESLFLFFSIASFWAGYTKKWWLAGLAGGLATATKLMGIFLLPSLVFIWWTSKNQERDRLSNGEKKFLQTIIDPSIFWLLIIPLGIGAYAFYLSWQLDDPLYFVHAQPFFSSHRQIDSFVLWPQVVWRYLKILTTVNWSLPIYYTSALEFVIGVGFAGLSLLVWKRLGMALGFYTLASYLLPTFTGSFSSLPRYVLVLFPAFIVLTEILEKHRWAKVIYLTVSLFLLLSSVIYFTRGWWIA